MIYFMNIEDLTCNFCGIYCFFSFSTSFYPIWMKKYQNLAKIKGYMTTNLVWSKPVLTGPRTAVFFSPCLNESKGPGLAVWS